MVLIGDAAHPFKPIGQGINIAMLDGMNIGLALTAVFPNNRAKALKYFNDQTKPQGDACIYIANNVMNDRGRLLDMIRIRSGL